ncbi:hypothetical protein D0812_21895 [Vibrio owensii]|uniref:Uncharacterized protein n=1 Tax=Vibrio owensii TaxID=696485 RepID=A0AAP9GG52_9VIBR|nr:hypothetical protein [Vibrio owensii]AYO17043.1 hypothetical protein D0812_21895 [Vibrio owensii]QGH49192.1 hypothetical protein APZ19_18920 [Vibrio owensii]
MKVKILKPANSELQRYAGEDLTRKVIQRVTNQIHAEADEVILAALAAGVPVTEIGLIQASTINSPEIAGYHVRIGQHVECCQVRLW